MSNDFDNAAAYRQTLIEIYWEVMNLGTTHKWLASDDGEINEYSPNYIVSQVLHEFAHKTIKPALEAVGINPFER